MWKGSLPELASGRQQQIDAGNCSRDCQSVKYRLQDGAHVNSDIVQTVIHPMEAVEQEERDDGQHSQLANAAGDERQHAVVAHRLAREQEPKRHGNTGHENQHRPDECGQHAARAEQGPENGLARALHGDIRGTLTNMARKTRIDAAIAATTPETMIVRSASRRPAIEMKGSVFGITLNQVHA